LHRVGRTGRHNDKGVALTISEPKQSKLLVESMKKIHNLNIQPLNTPT
jgi:superfamily II DNA/RNA helicase